MSTSKIKAYESVDIWVTRMMEFAIDKPSIPNQDLREITPITPRCGVMIKISEVMSLRRENSDGRVDIAGTVCAPGFSLCFCVLE